MNDTINVLVISTIFPNKNSINFGVFVKNRIKALSKLCTVEVISPVPYFPFIKYFGKYRERLKLPFKDTVDGIKVSYPRFFSFPGILKPLDGFFLALTIKKIIKKYNKKEMYFDVLDAHLAYPDGYSALIASKKYNIPVTITIRGHDVNYLHRYPLRKRQVKYALKSSKQVFSVCQKLLDEAKLSFCLSTKKGVVTYNGVDRAAFHPMERSIARGKIGFGSYSGEMILSIGYLVPRKGFNILIEAFNIIRKEFLKEEIRLIIIGERGGEKYIGNKLKNRVKELGLEKDVLFIKQIPHHELLYWYNASDLFCLASSHEGLPNVILESIVCGTPVVATNVWGIPEVIVNESIGMLVERGSSSCFAEILKKALNRKWDRSFISEYAERFNWDNTAKIIYNEFIKIKKRGNENSYKSNS
ncbi:glycosyltransferase family 4 protein [Chlamydiota bacterium]